MTRQERNDMYARIDDEIGRDGCWPMFRSLAVIGVIFWSLVAGVVLSAWGW